jgi:hypothetical protein
MTTSNFKYDHLEKLKKRLFDKYDGYKLKDGWEVQYSQRSKPGARPDPYFYSPTCNKNNFSSSLRSIPDVEKYLGLYDINQTQEHEEIQSSSTVEDLFKTSNDANDTSDVSVIYILTNPRYPEIKIGHSTGAAGRIKNFNSGNPEDFDIYKTFKSPFPIIKGKTKTSSPKTIALESIFHARYAHVRVPSGREFFDVDPEMVINEFEVDIEYLTRCQENHPELIETYLDIMLNIAKLKSQLDGL